MDEKEPSRTALGAAAYRAAHQTVEGGTIFADPLAHAILGANADAIIAQFAAADPAQTSMRIFMAARSRFAEDCLALAVARGVRQAVLWGRVSTPSLCAIRVADKGCACTRSIIPRPRFGSGSDWRRLC